MAPPAGRRCWAAGLRGGGVGGPSSSHRARMPGWTSRWGRGPLGHALDDQETFDPGRRLRPLSPAVAVVGTRPDGALACRPRAGVSSAPVETPACQRSSGAPRSRFACRPLLVFVQLGSEGSIERRVVGCSLREGDAAAYERRSTASVMPAARSRSASAPSSATAGVSTPARCGSRSRSSARQSALSPIIIAVAA